VFIAAVFISSVLLPYFASVQYVDISQSTSSASAYLYDLRFFFISLQN